MIPSYLLWVAKAFVFVFACVLSYQGKLSPETAAVFASTLLSLGVTNAATVVAKTRILATLIHQMAPGAIAPALPPTAPSVPPPATGGPPAVAVGMLVFAVCAVVTVAIINACTPAEREQASQIHDEGLRYECAHLPPLDAGHE